MLSTPLLASALVSCAALSRPAVMAREHLATTTTRTASISMQMAALLWDCDGVLADTERDGHRVSFNRVFSERSLGFEWGVEEYGKLCEVGGGKERMTAYFNARAEGWPEGYETPTTADLVKPKGLPVDPDRLALVSEMHQAKTRMFQELIGTGVVPLRSGVLRVVDEAIGAGVPLAVCSTSNEAAVRTLVQTLMGEERYAKFDFYCGDAVPRKKPQPDVYLLAAEKLKVEPRRCVVIEDSGIGLKAAKAAGMACLVTTSTYTLDDDFAAADRVVPALGEAGDAEVVGLADLNALLE